jgi:hypothetical protein
MGTQQCVPFFVVDLNIAVSDIKQIVVLETAE